MTLAEEAEYPIIQSSTPVRAFDELDEVAAVAVFPDGRRMATNSSNGTVHVWDLKKGVMLKEMYWHGEEMNGLALSRDGRMIATRSGSGNINIWHGDTGRPLAQVFGAESNPYLLDFSPDGTTLATGSWDSVKLWSTETWQPEGQPIGCHPTYCVQYSPSGELLAIVTQADIQIWNLTTRKCIASLNEKHAHSLVWTPDGTRLLSGNNTTTIREWDSLTWKQVGDTWKGRTDYPCRFTLNCNGTIVASPTRNNHLRLWRLSDRQTIAIFQPSGYPLCITFSVDGRHILVGGKDKKISEWPVPEHAWPNDAPKDQATHQAQECDIEVQNSDSVTKAQTSQASNTETPDSQIKVFSMNTTVRNACLSGNLPAAEELLTQDIDVNGDNYRSYSNRSIVMARKLDWDHALDDATKSLSIQPSLMGYISKGIALCGKADPRNANKAFDLASTFTDGDPKTIHFLYLVKAIALFNANEHADAMRRVRELAAACPNADTALACRIVEVYLHIQLGNNALDRACPTEAADHFTAAVNNGTFLSKSAAYSTYEDFVVLFGCDFASLWKTANQQRCHALLRAGRRVEVFEAFRYMADMSDESTKASCLDWSIGFMQELSMFRDDAPNAGATLGMCKYEDENDSISDIDSDLDHVDDVVS